MAANWSSVTNISSGLQIANSQSGGYFWTGMLFMGWCILFISMLAFGIEVALLASCFSALLVGVLMAYMGLVSWTWILMIIGTLLVTFLWIIYNQKDY